LSLIIPENLKDLIVLVADKNMDAALRGILSRPKSLGIRNVSFDIFAHPHHDPGCRLDAHSFLQTFLQSHQHSLVIFDREGCGGENCIAEELEGNVEGLLLNKGWQNRSAAVVIDPELETWAWRKSPHVSKALGWENDFEKLYKWSRQNGYLGENEIVPKRPKEALEAALRVAHKPRSSSIYTELAANLSLANCFDRSFLKLRSTLQSWFLE
jgi:hypothetical protein